MSKPVIIPATNKDNILEKMAANMLKVCMVVLVSMSLPVFDSDFASHVFVDRISFDFFFRKMALAIA